MTELANHLWQSTLVAAAAAVFAVVFRRHRARVRAAIWLVASLKFLVPLFALVAIGRAVPWPAMRTVASSSAVAAVETISQPFGTMDWDTSPRETPQTSAGASVWSLAILMLWATGTIVVATGAIVRARRSRAILHGARAMRLGREAEAVARVLQARPGARFDLLVTDARVSPGVVGIRRPALLWPLGLTEHLSDAQLDAVVAHEIGHVERRDNLAAVALNAVRALFWFHPVVWWLDSRWREERERACDERVLARDDDAEQYADGILKVGEFCVGAMAMDHARMAGARLTGRIEAIMNRNAPKTLGWTGRIGLTIAMTVVVFGPVMFGATLQTRSTVDDRRVAATPDQSVTPSNDKGVSGVVTDATGGTIPGATVSVTPVGSANAQSVVSRADGRFAIADLADGAYRRARTAARIPHVHAACADRRNVRRVRERGAGDWKSVRGHSRQGAGAGDDGAAADRGRGVAGEAQQQSGQSVALLRARAAVPTSASASSKVTRSRSRAST